MIRIDSVELKEIQLDVLQCVHDFCREKGLQYSLAYGTLIGAVRHKGYIPWDDDIDIMMPRKDYEIFLQSFNGYHSDYSVSATQINKYYYAPYANVYNNKTLLVENGIKNGNIGIKIDVFPIDRIPMDRNKRIVLYEKVDIFQSIIYLKNCNIKHIKERRAKVLAFLIQKCLYFIPFSLILDRLAYKQDSKNCDSSIVNNIVWCRAGEKGCFPKSSMNKYVDMKFETRLFKVLEGYDVFLKSNYGDYMQLPPIEQQVPFHGFEAYWK